MWRNDTKCKYMFMFPLNLARKRLSPRTDLSKYGLGHIAWHPFLVPCPVDKFLHLIIPPTSTKLKAPGILVSPCRSVRLSICGQNRVRSVSSTILIGSISYLHILSTNFRRCVACNAHFRIQKFEILTNFLPEASIGLRVLSLPASVCVCVCPSVRQSRACPRDNSWPVSARITKFGP